MGIKTEADPAALPHLKLFPVCSDEVPGQPMSHHVVAYAVNDDGRSVRSSRLLRI